MDRDLQHHLDTLRQTAELPDGAPAPPGAYEALRAVLQQVPTLDKKTRAEVTTALKPHGQWLLGYAHGWAAESVRVNSPDELRAGFTAIALENDQNDPRDVLVTLALLVHSAQKVGLSGDTMLQEAIAIACPPTRKILRSFLKRSPEDRRIERMGHREGTSPEGFVYRPTR